MSGVRNAENAVKIQGQYLLELNRFYYLLCESTPFWLNGFSNVSFVLKAMVYPSIVANFLKPLVLLCFIDDSSNNNFV